MSEPKPRPLRVAVVGIPGAWSSERLADALATHGSERLLIDAATLRADLDARRVFAGELALGGLDGLVIKKLDATYGPHMLDRLELIRLAEQGGLRVFQPPRAIMGLIDRLACSRALVAAGLPLPPTVVTEDLGAAVDAVERFGEAILKPLYSTKARGMLVLRSTDPDLREQLGRAQTEHGAMLYLQQRVDIPGRDLGVVFIGDEYIGTYARVKAEGAWNTTTRAGGKYAAHEASPAVVELADRARRIFGLDFSSVDVVETTEGPLVFEVSAFGGFRGLKEASGIDAADAYARYIVEELVEHQGRHADVE